MHGLIYYLSPLWALILFLPQAWGYKAHIALVADTSLNPIVHTLQTQLYTNPGLDLTLTRLEPKQIRDPHILTNTPFSLIVAIGYQANRAIFSVAHQRPVLSLLIRKNDYEDLLSGMKSPAHFPRTAIYLDQPYERQLNMIQLILKEMHAEGPIGILLGPASQRDLQQLKQLGLRKKATITLARANHGDNPIEVINLLLNESKILLAIPDNVIFNPHAARGLLLSAYRKRVPLVGYSKNHVNNGALAAVFSSATQIAQEASKEIIAIIQHPNHSLPPPRYMKDFSVAVNYEVARVLHLNIDTENILKQKILAAELSAQENIPYGQ